MGLQVATETADDHSPESLGESRPAVAGAAEAAKRKRPRAPHVSVVVVVAIGLLITAGLSYGANALHDSNENRLLRQRVREVGALVSAAIPNVQTPLASAAVLAEATKGDPKSFRQLVGPIIAAGRPFNSVSLWSARAGTARPLVVAGVRPDLASESQAHIEAMLHRAIAFKGNVAINNLLNSGNRRLGYGLTAPSPSPRYVVYAEAVLPKQRRAAIDKNSAFADLGYALYLGKVPDSRFLLASSTGGALLHGRRASVTVPFGDSHLLVVMTPHKELGGNLLARLWWSLGILLLLLTFGAGVLVSRISSRRKDAELLALENARLYTQQRSVAQTLQHSLLAEAFPEIGGLEFAASYVAGVEGIDIGGDWYDVVRLERGNILLVVGDVSGRGLEAATMMASLRYAARAYAAEGHSPGVILTKLSGLVSIGRDGHFATVLCGSLDVSNARVTLANAGHPEPLLVRPDGAELVPTSVGVPVGVGGGPPYSEVEFAFPRGSTLLLYTDGAIERRGESLDVGLQRLKDVSVGATGTLEEFLAAVADGVLGAGAEDDTALLGVRWRE